MGQPVNIFVIASFVAACSAKVPQFPQPGETLRAGSFVLEAGGKGFNVAVAMKRLGADVDGLMAAGADLLGDFAERSLVDAGLPAHMLRRLPGPTGAGVGLISASGENCIAVFPGANALLGAQHVASASRRLRCARAVLAQFEIEDEPIIQAFEIAGAHGATRFLNPSPYRPIAPALLRNTDVLVLNAVEATQASRPQGADAATPDAWRPWVHEVFDGGVAAIVVTRGASGATCFRPDQPPMHQPAYPTAAVDTIGAGDAFLAGLAVALAEGRSWAEGLRRAAACGAFACRTHGVLAALPTADDLDAFLSEISPSP